MIIRLGFSFGDYNRLLYLFCSLLKPDYLLRVVVTS